MMIYKAASNLIFALAACINGKQKTMKLISVTTLFFAAAFAAFSQSSTMPDKPAQNWHLLDMTKDRVPGTGAERAYTDLIAGKSTTTVVVAVIDSGVDIEHEDLRDNIWVNEDEIPNNGIDDDKNGYIDDMHGWSFISGPGGDVKEDNLEFTRIYKDLYFRFNGRDAASIPAVEKADYQKFLKFKADYENRVKKSEEEWNEFRQILGFYELSKTTVANLLGKENYTVDELKEMPAEDDFTKAIKDFMLLAKEGGLEYELAQGREQLEGALLYSYNLDFDPRHMVGDNYSDTEEKYYGTPNVKGPASDHGTHVAGIIGAVRGNGIGIDGICSDVKIMALRAVPLGDERDKDVANAIYYAVDNGAHIINMSFGKSYSPQKSAVDKAVKYAESKGVLLVHAAGNSSKNNDISDNYPNPVDEVTREWCATWVEVGASSSLSDPDFVAEFSNYGKLSVDLFAPGQDIYSTMPGNTYRFQSGTSMASPVVAGVAALVKSYYPELSGKDLKEVLVNSYTDYKKVKVRIPGSTKKVPFAKICRTGGIVNAYNALKMAEEYSKRSEEEKAGKSSKAGKAKKKK